MRVSTDGEMDLVIRLVEKAATVRGYLLSPAVAKDETGVLIGRADTTDAERRFEFTDSNEDGVFTARISTGDIGRENELVTVIDYENALKPREVVLVTVMNLSGNILGEDNQPLGKAFVTLLQQNPETGLFERWPAEDGGRSNPVLTENSGHYYFVPPAGTYRLEVIREGYENYQSTPLKITEGQAVNFDVTLSPVAENSVSASLLFLFSKLKDALKK